MARRSSQNMSRKACAEHEIWDPFSKLHPMQLSGKKAMVDTCKNQTDEADMLQEIGSTGDFVQWCVSCIFQQLFHQASAAESSTIKPNSV